MRAILTRLGAGSRNGRRRAGTQSRLLLLDETGGLRRAARPAAHRSLGRGAAAPPARPVPASCLGTAWTLRPSLAALSLTVSAFAIACQQRPQIFGARHVRDRLTNVRAALDRPADAIERSRSDEGSGRLATARPGIFSLSVATGGETFGGVSALITPISAISTSAVRCLTPGRSSSAAARRFEPFSPRGRRAS